MLANAVHLAADQTLTDETIISRVLHGKTEDYEILVRRYNNLLYKTARGILSAENDIEDVMQEAYIRGYEKLGQFRQEAKFSTWLTRILINCALQHLNKLKGRAHLSLDVLVREGIDGEENAPMEKTNAEVGENLAKALEGAISHLPAKYRVVFILREVQHLPVADAATIIGITEENVKIRLYRAKAMLKDMLQAKLNVMEIFEFHATRCTRVAERVMTEIYSIQLKLN
ncbi:MAG TPA: sigma-70 family RNA polymerase sigma factor [Chryseolinea sp.]|nr:sigma-70 family RNA polymerase sigma factor [Chryseolinea sp.]